MIQVSIPNNFIPERSYAVRTLLTHYCGVPVEIKPVDGIHQYELRWQDKSILIEDGFFGKIPEGKSYADLQYVPEKIIQTTAPGLDGILMLYGSEQLESTPDKIVCHVDVFAGLFFMLTRWEESLGLYEDLHGRFPASHAAVVKNGFILRPVVDEYAALLRGWLQSIGYPVPRDILRYTVVPTCDVDIPHYWRSRPLWKILGGRFTKHWNPIKAAKDIREYQWVESNSKQDPYDTFDYMMQTAENAGSSMQFNFIGGGKTRFEGYYAIHDAYIKTLIQKMMARGHQIGLHPSYDAYDDTAMMLEEKAAVEKSAGVHVTTSRQHYLRCIIPGTWQKLAEAGIKEDSTLGYAAEPGFRCGTCKPYPVFDIHQRKELTLTERPLLIMDVSLRMYKNLSIEESIALCEKIKEQVKKHNGELVFLWHNSSLSEIDGWSGWGEVFENLIG